MNVPNVLLVVIVAAVSVVAIAMVLGDFKPQIRRFLSVNREFLQSGDTSLSPRSVNWLAATAVSAALIIGFLLH